MPLSRFLVAPGALGLVAVSLQSLFSSSRASFLCVSKKRGLYETLESLKHNKGLNKTYG